MKTTTPTSFLSRVRASLPDLHPSERRLAEAVLNFPGDMAGYSASEVAEVAGVSNATVSRFVRKIGYASYEEARRAVREEGRSGAALLRFGAEDKAFADPITAHLEQSQLNLQATFAGIEVAAVDDLVTAAHKASRIWCAGFRAGFPIATYIGWQVGQVLPDVRVVPKAGETLAETAASFKNTDILILIALRRAPKNITTLAEAALARGTRIAMISDLPGLEAFEISWRFSCATTSGGPLLNHTAVLALANLISARILEKSDSNARARLAQIEDLHDRFSEL